jgi:hypothetical protein
MEQYGKKMIGYTMIQSTRVAGRFRTGHGAIIGVVSGDFVVGFIAQDQNDRVLGHYPTFERSMYAVQHKPSADLQASRRPRLRYLS